MDNDEELEVIGELFYNQFGGWGLKLDTPVNGHSFGMVKLFALSDGTIGWEPTDA